MVAERWQSDEAEAAVLERSAVAWARLQERIAHRFGRVEVRLRVRRFLAGLLGRVARKNGWPVAEAIGEPGPRGVQRLLLGSCWDAEAVRDDPRASVIEQLGEEDGVLIIDETGFPKTGTCSCGVAGPYSGAAGRCENAQVGVFLAYAASRGTAFLDRALYLPRTWTSDRAHMRAAGVPPDVRFATKVTLAIQLLARAFAAAVPARWVVADCLYGRVHHFRAWLERHGQAYVVGMIPAQVVVRAGRRQRALALAARLPPTAWQRLSAGTGSQGDRVHDWACVPLEEDAPAGRGRWLLGRRSLADPAECAYFRAYGPLLTPPARLVRLAGTRWAVEEAFAQAKGEVGRDQDEVRQWEAWYRHRTLCLLAHAFLVVVSAQAHDARTSGPKKRGCFARRADPDLRTRGTAAASRPADRCGRAGLPPGLVTLATSPSGGRATLPWSTLARDARLPRQAKHRLCALSPLVSPGTVAAYHRGPRPGRASGPATTHSRYGRRTVTVGAHVSRRQGLPSA